MLDRIKEFNKDLENDNILPFLKPLGKEPPNNNWLGNLAKGTRFLANRKNLNHAELGDFLVASDPKQMRAVYLGYDLNNREGGFRFVDPIKFSRDYDLYDILSVDTIPEEQEHGNNPEIQEGRVGGDEGVKE